MAMMDHVGRENRSIIFAAELLLVSIWASQYCPLLLLLHLLLQLMLDASHLVVAHSDEKHACRLFTCFMMKLSLLTWT